MAVYVLKDQGYACDNFKIRGIRLESLTKRTLKKKKKKMNNEDPLKILYTFMFFNRERISSLYRRQKKINLVTVCLHLNTYLGFR